MAPNSNNLMYPDSAIRLAARVHLFRVPRIPDTKVSNNLSFAKSFNLASGDNAKTRQVMLHADACRSSLKDAVSNPKYLSYSRVVQEAKRYVLVIYQIFLSCKLQPEEAQLDVPLVFEWLSGIEQNPKPCASQTLMYELVMAVMCEGLGRAGCASESSVSAEYSSASSDFATAAGIFRYLARDMLPRWTDKGTNVKEENLPSESSVAMAEALHQLFHINRQQMEVATWMLKPSSETTDFVRLSKLSFGIVQQLESLISVMRKDCKIAMERIDKDFLTLLAIQIGLYKSLTYYFQARSVWAKREYGMAIALLRDSISELKTRESPTSATGVPDLSKMASLATCNKDLQQFRAHQEDLFKLWKHDNSSVFMERIPAQIPASVKLDKGEILDESDEYKLQVVEPITLKLTCDKGNILRAMTRSANHRGVL